MAYFYSNDKLAQAHLEKEEGQAVDEGILSSQGYTLIEYTTPE